MKKIDVQITKAQIESFSVALEDNLPLVNATIALYTAGSKRISSYSISSRSYHTSKFELPLEMIDPIMKIARRLEAIVTMECNKSMSMIEVKPDVPPKKEEPVVVSVQDEIKESDEDVVEKHATGEDVNF